MNGKIVCVSSPQNTGIIHALDTDGPRDVWHTYCGRRAGGFYRVRETNIAVFLDTVCACKRCIRGLCKDMHR